jgi:hypothetical protein
MTAPRPLQTVLGAAGNSDCGCRGGDHSNRNAPMTPPVASGGSWPVRVVIVLGLAALLSAFYYTQILHGARYRTIAEANVTTNAPTK